MVVDEQGPAKSMSSMGATKPTVVTKVLSKKLEKDDKNPNTREAETITASVPLMKDVKYTVKFEVLQNDLANNWAHETEKVKEVKVGGESWGECQPKGKDTDCTFFHCKFEKSKPVSTSTGELEVSFTNIGHSKDCDCDESNWKCYKEDTKDDLTPMVMVGRFTFTPAE